MEEKSPKLQHINFSVIFLQTSSTIKTMDLAGTVKYIFLDPWFMTWVAFLTQS